MSYNCIINNLPFPSTKFQSFCLWQYASPISEKGKPRKVPHLCNMESFTVFPGLNNKQYWLSLQEFIEIRNFYHQKKLEFNYGLGIILTGSSIVVIDLDNCIINDKVIPEANKIIELFPGAYTEVSPSKKGLHIMFQGDVPFTRERGIMHLNESINATIEMYSGKSTRFITLTGQKICSTGKSSGKPSKLPVFESSSPLYNKLSKYFESPKKSKMDTSLSIEDNSVEQETEQYDNSTENAFTQDLLIDVNNLKSSIKKLGYDDQYCSLKSATCDDKTLSQHDWAFCLFILNFIKPKMPKIRMISLLRQLLINERPYRQKIERHDYIDLTVKKAIEYAKDSVLIGSKLKGSIKIKEVNKKAILKICNYSMNIFLLGKDKLERSRTLKCGSGTNNYVEFHIPYSLSGLDLDNYVTVLSLFNRKSLVHDFSIDNYLEIEDLKIELSYPDLARCMNKKDTGTFRRNFLETLKKMSSITMTYHKCIDKSSEVRSGTTYLMQYHVKKNNSNIGKTEVKLNPFTFIILKKSTSNYSLINTEDRALLSNADLRLLYNYLCTKAFPGAKYFNHLSIISIMEDLWLNTDNTSTFRSRKQRLVKMLSELDNMQDKLSDFSMRIIDNKKTITGIELKRSRVKLT